MTLKTLVLRICAVSWQTTKYFINDLRQTQNKEIYIHIFNIYV